MQVTVKFGEHLTVFNEIESDTMGKELKSLIKTRLVPLMFQNSRFEVRSLMNGRFLRENQTLEEVCQVMFSPGIFFEIFSNLSTSVAQSLVTWFAGRFLWALCS